MPSLDFQFSPNPAFTPGGREYFEDYNRQLQAVVASKQKTKVDDAEVEVLGSEQVDLATVVKQTKDGSWSRQSIAGQVVGIAEGMGHDIRALQFRYRKGSDTHTGHSIYGAHHGIRWIIRNDTECWLNGELLTKNAKTPVQQLKEAIVNSGGNHAPDQ